MFMTVLATIEPAAAAATCAERVTSAHVDWAFGDGGPSRQAYQATVAQSDGDLVSVGNYDTSAAIGLSTDAKVSFSDGGFGAFLVRHHGDGSLVWARRLASGSGPQFAMDVAARVDGSLVATGRFSGATTFGEGAAAVSVPAGVVYRGYVASFDRNGTLQWVRTFSATTQLSVDAIATNADGDAVVYGGFTGDLSFDGSSLTPISSTDERQDAFVLSYAPDGSAMWRRAINGQGFQYAYGDSRAGAGTIRGVAGGDVMIVGAFDAAAVFEVGDGTTQTMTGSLSTVSMYVARYHADGALVSADLIGTGVYAIPFSISVAGDGSFAIAGHGNGPYTFGSGPSAVSIGADVFEDGFVARYASNMALQWAHTIESSQLANAYDVVVTPSGAVTVSGIYLGSAVAHGGSGDVAIPTQPMPAASFTSSYVARYSPTGDVRWVQALVNANAYGLAPVGDDVVAAGEFTNWAAFDPDTKLCTDGSADGFLARYGDDLSSTIRGIVRDGASNPIAGITVTVMGPWPGWGFVRTTRTAADGSYVVAGLPAGTYRLRWFDGLGRFDRRWAGTSDTYRHGSDLVVVPGQQLAVDGVLHALSPGDLGGSVVDGTGTRLGGIVVQVFLGDAYFGGTRTDGTGAWRMFGLPAGSYRVRYVDPTFVFATEWYDDVHEEGPLLATVLSIAGQSVTIAATLAP